MHAKFSRSSYFERGHPVVFSCLLNLILAFSQHATYNVNYALMRHVSTRMSHHQDTLYTSIWF